ncbi:putative conserved glutamic acid rich protein [Neofusicoccum parvum UCRNP2]|uniref:Putative conserved glutamic acid rich protein n=1 Tax=Botryosphaeria parva (strain UCR-NP2) TaxID=1287680 RepID=R1EGD0_BOTPV|nr:putative conserved glutamic acid rich protein [Neofusicoccum parvum UCRNP2]
MGSRRAYPTAEFYDERERDFYGGSARRSQRDFGEFEQDIRGPRTEYSRRPGPQPDFLREEYGRTSAGPLVVSERRTVRDDWSPPPPKPRKEVEREEIIIRDRSDRKSERPPPSRSSHSDREEIIFRRDGPPPPKPRPVEREEYVIRRDERSPPEPPKSKAREEIIFRHEERSPPPQKPKPREIDREEIVFRRGEGDYYTSPSHRPWGENGKSYDEDIIFEHETKERKPQHEDFELVHRHRSASLPRRKVVDEWDVDSEADYYNRKAMERAYMGEAHNGATKDWAIVDVPPGTNRVRMEGVGGGRQEVTWQRYNGVRRSKFYTEDHEYASDWGAPAPAPPPLPAPKNKPPADMWTEITKDLVIKEAIDTMGYDYEETDFFFYVMDYLRYEDVLQLVEISDDIRRERRQRIREIELERKRIEAPPAPKPPKEYDYYEREVIYERDDRRGRYR